MVDVNLTMRDSSIVKIVIKSLTLRLKERLMTPAAFFVDIFLMFATKITAIAILGATFYRVEKLAGVSFGEALLILGFANCSYALWSSFAINTISVPYYINQGTIDRFMTRPRSVLLQIILDGFDEDAFGEFVFGVICIVWAINNLGLEMTLSRMLMLPCFIIFGGIVYLILSVYIAASAFWINGYQGLSDFLHVFCEFGSYPVGIYPKSIRFALSYILPIAFTGSFPAHYLILGSISRVDTLIPVSVTFVIAVCGAFFWKVSLQRYQGAGS